MKKVILFLVLLALFMAHSTSPVWAHDGIKMVTTVTNAKGESQAVPGTLFGLTKAPSGDYRVKINNCKSLKGKTFSVMNCTVYPYIDTLLDVVNSDHVIVLQTTFYDKGEYTTKIGYLSNCDKAPKNGYIVNIKNGKKVKYWNSLNCAVK